MAGGKWGDLTKRVISAIVLLAIGAALLLAGGVALRLLVAALTAITIWELARMTGWRHPDMHRTLFGHSRPLGLALLAGLALYLGLSGALPGGELVLLVPVLAGLPGALARDRIAWVLFSLAIMVVGYQLVVFREAWGTIFLLWVMGIVIISDTAGYFAGRMIGGPKFWPRISPKKTWSGTVAGWIGAAIWGAALGYLTGRNPVLLALVSIPISLAGQLGDIAESWLKRRAGVKDSSNLIPGHGGFMDRFDALSGAVLAVTLVMLLGWPLPGIWQGGM